MANIRQTRTGRWQLTLTSKLLPKGRAWFTFDSQPEAEAYGAQADKWLAAGLVPPELAETATADKSGLLGPVIRGWCNTGDPSAADQEVLGRLFVEVGAERLADLTYAWCERWVGTLKLERNLSPGSIRKRVQALSRALDWHLRRQPGAMIGNPLHMLPRGYSTYNAREAAQAQALGKEAKTDQSRDRRLADGDEAAILQALAGHKRPDRQRALQPCPEFSLLFALILGTGMRLREAYRVRVGQVDMAARVVRPQASKVWHGRVRHRAIPLTPALHQALTDHLAAHPAAADALLLPSLWDGQADTLKAATGRLSARFAALFSYAGLVDLTEHDLRHEATCRWLELRRADGAPLYRIEEVTRIMGWAPGSAMAQRYASFQAEDLAGRMWAAPALVRVA